MPAKSVNRLSCFWCLLGVVLALSGCSSSAKPDAEKALRPSDDIALRLVVVDDPALAAAVGELRSEWRARTGATVTLEERPSAEVTGADSLTHVDAIIYPSRLLGMLAERQWISLLPADYASNQELAWRDMFELTQIAEATWGQAPHAVPFGSPVLTCFYRPDLLEKLHRKPPETWEQYHELAAFFSRRENLGDAAPPIDARWFGAAEPLAPGWAGRVLLARAAAYAKHHDHYSALFNMETMEPLIGTAAFVRALEELVADAKLGPPDTRALDPAEVRREFYDGRCALALTWPGHAAADQQAPGGPAAKVAFVELPGSARVYNFASKQWEDRPGEESRHVPLLAAAGRLGSVAQGSAHPQNAFQLLCWLCGQEWGTKVASASAATTLFRRSQMRQPHAWVDPSVDLQAAQQYALTVRDALNRQNYLFAPRIPGEEKYLAALDTAVQQALAGEKPPAEALQEAAAAWGQITAELDMEKQRTAYRKSLGLE